MSDKIKYDFRALGQHLYCLEVYSREEGGQRNVFSATYFQKAEYHPEQRELVLYDDDKCVGHIPFAPDKICEEQWGRLANFPLSSVPMYGKIGDYGLWKDKISSRDGKGI